MLRRAISLLTLVFYPSIAHAGDIAVPTGAWEIEHSSSACIAKRSYGQQVLSIQPSPLGGWTRLAIEGPGRAPGVRQYWSTIDIAKGTPPIKATSMIYPLEKRGRRGIMTVFADSDVERLFAAGHISLRSGLKNDPRVTFANREMNTTSAALSLDSTEALKTSLALCLADLKKSWGFDGDKLPEPPIRARPVIDLARLFTDDDYPADAMSAHQVGKTAYLLLVDEQGRVADCSIKRSSGVASLDAMGCQILTQRAKFVPAIDRMGRSAKDIYEPPGISWRIVQD